MEDEAAAVGENAEEIVAGADVQATGADAGVEEMVVGEAEETVAAGVVGTVGAGVEETAGVDGGAIAGE